MIPVEIDTQSILSDLNAWGWKDFKIETVCGFSSGYIAQIRCGNVKMLAYQRAARLYNFWESEGELQAGRVSRGTLQTRVESVTT